jgi:hypothetical protein
MVEQLDRGGLSRTTRAEGNGVLRGMHCEYRWEGNEFEFELRKSWTARGDLAMINGDATTYTLTRLNSIRSVGSRVAGRFQHCPATACSLSMLHESR